MKIYNQCYYATNRKGKILGNEWKDRNSWPRKKAIKNQVEILEMKNTITEVKHSLDGLKNRM